MSGNGVTVFNVSHQVGQSLAYPVMFYFHFQLMTVTYCLFVDVLNGYNGTIFAYGQTASGKTHTIEVCLISTSLKVLRHWQHLVQLEVALATSCLISRSSTTLKSSNPTCVLQWIIWDIHFANLGGVWCLIFWVIDKIILALGIVSY